MKSLIAQIKHLTVSYKKREGSNNQVNASSSSSSRRIIRIMNRIPSWGINLLVLTGVPLTLLGPPFRSISQDNFNLCIIYSCFDRPQFQAPKTRSSNQFQVLSFHLLELKAWSPKRYNKFV